jgi:hypothetical protein
MPGSSQRSGCNGSGEGVEKRTVITGSATANTTMQAAPVHMITCRQMAAETRASLAR